MFINEPNEAHIVTAGLIHTFGFSYSNIVGKFYAPIIFGQFFYLAVYGCAALYMTLVVSN